MGPWLRDSYLRFRACKGLGLKGLRMNSHEGGDRILSNDGGLCWWILSLRLSCLLIDMSGLGNTQTPR